jgi:hypothetical protein
MKGLVMTLPIRFPNESDVIHEQAAAYRRLSPTDRLLALLDLIASGAALLERSPHRAMSARLREAQEAEWQRAQKELFARHAR